MRELPMGKYKRIAEQDIREMKKTLDALPDTFDPETINIVNTWAGGSTASAPGLTSALTQNGNAKVYPLSKTMIFGIDLTF